MKTFSVVIPCHNEEGSIGQVLAQVRNVLPDAEIIVVDDGSTDRTAQVVDQAGIDGVNLIRMPTNEGKGRALQRGMAHAGGDYLVFIDGDGQDDPSDLAALVSQAQAGHRFVNGSKFIGRIEKGGISPLNYWGNRFMSGTINFLFGADVTDSQSGFRILERAMATRWSLEATEYEIETEMLIRALKQGVRIREVPVVRKARPYGATGFRRVRNGMRILWTILRHRFGLTP